MIVAGLDVGSKNVHAVVIRDGEVAARASVLSGFDHEESAARGLAEAAAGGRAGARPDRPSGGDGSGPEGSLFCDGATY